MPLKLFSKAKGCYLNAGSGKFIPGEAGLHSGTRCKTAQPFKLRLGRFVLPVEGNETNGKLVFLPWHIKMTVQMAIELLFVISLEIFLIDQRRINLAVEDQGISVSRSTRRWSIWKPGGTSGFFLRQSSDISFSRYKIMPAMINAKVTDSAIVTTPGMINGWLNTYFPIRVEPVSSISTAAISVG